MDYDNGSRKRLHQSTIVALLSGRYARVGGTTPRSRGWNLAQIAASYTRDELLAENGIGPRKADIVEQWLAGQGLALRQPHPRTHVLADDPAERA